MGLSPSSTASIQTTKQNYDTLTQPNIIEPSFIIANDFDSMLNYSMLDRTPPPSKSLTESYHKGFKFNPDSIIYSVP